MGWQNSGNPGSQVTGPDTKDWITSAALMGINLWSGYDTGKTNRYVNRKMAEISDIQAEAEIVRANKENLYRNEEAALQGWGADRELRALKASQKVAQAASGTYGPGDDRLTQDAESKAFRQRRDMLRALQLESFERSNAAKIAAIGYRGKAKQYRIAAKNSLKAGIISGLAQGLNDTTKYMTAASTFWKKAEGSTYKDTKTKTIDKAIGSKYNPNKLSLYTFRNFEKPSGNFWNK